MSDVRLIDANAVVNYIDDCIEESKEEREDAKFRGNDCEASYNAGEIQIARRIKRQINLAIPSIDAVQVVRCRECVFRGQHDLCPMNVRVYMLDEAAYLDCTEDDGFCHKGEKMDGGATDGV